MKKTLALMSALLLLTPSIALSQSRTGPRHGWLQLGTLINNQTLASARSFTVQDSGFGMGLLVLLIKETRDGGLTNVTMTCTGSEDNNVTDFQFQDCSVSAGVCTSSDASWSQAISANKNWVWRVDTLGVPGDIECTFTPTGGDAGDFLTVTGWMVTQ